MSQYDVITFQEVGDVLKLRDVVLAVAALTLQHLEVFPVLLHGVRLIEARQHAVNHAPV